MKNTNKSTFLKRIYNYKMLLPFLVPLLIYAYMRSSGQFWDSTVSDALATLYGVIFGIPIALSINRKVMEDEEKRKEISLSKKNKEVLHLILEELGFNNEQLKIRQKREGVPLIGFQIEVWEALSSGGEIRWIKNIKVLGSIASAYSMIKDVKEKEEIFYSAAKGRFAFSGTENATNSILQDLKRFHPVIEIRLKEAIKSINGELENSK